MARSRNIKPGFFKNELLVEQSMFVRLLFIGLWTLADRDGRIEDRPKKIRLELFPYDNDDVDAALSCLSGLGFIIRYNADNKNVIQICNFLKHQAPHGTEKDSELPDENGKYIIHERDSRGYVKGRKRAYNVNLTENNVNLTENNVHLPGNNALIPDSLIPDSLIPDSLIPDSLIPDSLIPDSLIKEKDKEKIPKRKSQPAKIIPPTGINLESSRILANPLEGSSGDQGSRIKALHGFDVFWETYDKKISRLQAERAWKKIKITEELLETIQDAAREYVKSTPDKSYRKHPATWLNGACWNDEVIKPMPTIQKPEKFDPFTYVNRDRISHQPLGKTYEQDYETIDITPKRLD